ncbi:PrpF domain-containing protein [Acinetobacter nectaris]|uniref:PrpF domain-containing protein n=1 Tax=Acinetobacter nectaris TaxID=1219382 RepID=UPI00301637C0|nr:hypothetical protein [Acinetobacter nectaris]
MFWCHYTKKYLPDEKEEINEIVRKIFGVPRKDGEKVDNSQLEGIGKGKSTSNKCFIIDVDTENKVVFSTFLQLESLSNHVSWEVNCGNMTTAIPLVIDDLGLTNQLVDINNKINIYNTNTQKKILCEIPKKNDSFKYCQIPGINNEYPEVDIFFSNPEGSLTNGPFPTGNKIDKINGIEVSCIDAVVPMVIIDAKSLDIDGHEDKYILLSMPDLLEKIELIRISAGVMMQIKAKSSAIMDGEQIRKSITIPKVAIVSKGSKDADITIIYLTPKEIHNSIAISGGSCLTYACSIHGTIASNLFYGNEVRIKHFAGVSSFGCIKREGTTEIYTKRNAQIYMKGDFYIY